jgi:antitoxin YefM
LTLLTRMMVMTTTSLADAKARLSELVASAEKTHERTVITKNGRPTVALVSIEDLESLEETIEVLSDPDTLADLREAEINGEYGFFYTQGEIREMVDRRLSGNPMTEDELEARVAERMGHEAYQRARAGIREALSRDPDANVRERARFYAA